VSDRSRVLIESRRKKDQCRAEQSKEFIEGPVLELSKRMLSLTFRIIIVVVVASEDARCEDKGFSSFPRSLGPWEQKSVPWMGSQVVPPYSLLQTQVFPRVSFTREKRLFKWFGKWLCSILFHPIFVSQNSFLLLY
jgi:hypothetical protein